MKRRIRKSVNALCVVQLALNGLGYKRYLILKENIHVLFVMIVLIVVKVGEIMNLCLDRVFVGSGYEVFTKLFFPTIIIPSAPFFATT